ncbi:minor tail protein [Microbacterium phage Fede]|nr:minor tail protein [Microbacterium phage Fede]
MPTLSNSPQDTTVFEVEARKSFSFGIWLNDSNGNPCDLTGSSTTFTVGKIDRYGISTVLFSKVAVIQAPTLGYETVQVQASDLELKPGVYQFSTTLRIQGYSVVLMKGDFKVLQNTEFESADVDYTAVNPSQNLEITLRDNLNVHISLSSVLPPNLSTPTDASDVAVAGYVGNESSQTYLALDAAFATEAELALKADQTYVDQGLSNTLTQMGLIASFLDTNKADITYVDAQIPLKISTTPANVNVTSELLRTGLGTSASPWIINLPTRLRSAAVAVTNMDSAVGNGWFTAAGSTVVNGPPGLTGQLMCYQEFNGVAKVQTVRDPSNFMYIYWRRVHNGTSWGAWTKFAEDYWFSAARFPSFMASGTGNQVLSGAQTQVPLTLTNAVINNGNYYDNTIYTFTCPVAGLYEFAYTITPRTVSGGVEGVLFKNGSALPTLIGPIAYTNYNTATMIYQILLVAGDTLVPYIRNNNGTTVDIDRLRSSFSGKLLVLS